MARQAGRDEGVGRIGRIGREAGDAREAAGAGEACGRRHARADTWARRASRASRGWRTFWRGRGGVRAVVASVVASFSVMAFAAATLPVSWRVAAAAERTRSGGERAGGLRDTAGLIEISAAAPASTPIPAAPRRAAQPFAQEFAQPARARPVVSPCAPPWP
ncbi:cellulase, partial [Burkholderia pseudomallei]